MPLSGSHSNSGEVISKGQSSTASAGNHSNTDDNGDELVVDTRVKFREWDPVRVLFNFIHLFDIL